MVMEQPCCQSIKKHFMHISYAAIIKKNPSLIFVDQVHDIQ